MTQIVIEIPDEVKQAFDRASNQDIYGCYYDYNSVIGKAIKNGIVLPKGLGRLIDVDTIQVIELEDSLHFMQHKKGDEVNFNIDVPTIIGADRSEKE